MLTRSPKQFLAAFVPHCNAGAPPAISSNSSANCQSLSVESHYTHLHPR